MEKFHGLIKNKKGQFAIESVLLMTILVGGFLAMTKVLKEKKVLELMVKPATQKMKTMTAMGTWKPDGCTSLSGNKQTLGKCHPNSIHRSLSSDPGF